MWYIQFEDLKRDTQIDLGTSALNYSLINTNNYLNMIVPKKYFSSSENRDISFEIIFNQEKEKR